MIYSLRGKLIHKEPFLAVVECGGVGYACRITYTTAAELGETGDDVFLYTFMNFSQDNVELFGFAQQQELHCFKQLISVSKVGPKIALSVLSDLDPQRFALAVASGDSRLISKSKGVGAKMAQRIVLELKDKISKGGITAEDIRSAGNTAVPVGDSAQEAVTALAALGFTQSEAAEAVAQTDNSQPTEIILKQALKILSSKK